MLRIALILALAAVTVPVSADAATPTPYSAVYSVAYRGLQGGLVHFALRREEGNRFVFESRAEPSFLAQFFVGESALERTVMRIDGDGVRPLSWYTEDGKSGNRRDGELTFAWEEGKVTGTVEGERVELPTEPGLQDRLSIQIALMTALLRGEEPGTIPMVADDRVKHYSYTRAWTGRLETEAGAFETIMYESTRPGSDRLSRVWSAPALGYIPIRAEQMRKGKLETVVELVRVERGGESR